MRLLSLVSDVRALVRVIGNLSGLGRSFFDPLLTPSVAQRMTLTAAHGESLCVNSYGAGPPVVLVHGLGGSRHDWNAAAQCLAAGYRVITLDLRGHGSRAAVNERPTLSSLARDIGLVIDRLCPEPPLLVGHSLGALVVMQYIKECGTKGLAGVCFVDQSPRITNDTHWRLGLFGSVTRAQLESIVAHLKGALDAFVDGPRGRMVAAGVVFGAVVAKLHERIAPVLSIVESLIPTDFRDVVARLPVPALVVLGGDSHHYGGLPLAEYYETTLPQGTVLTYSDSSHSPHRHDPRRFAADLGIFADKIFPDWQPTSASRVKPLPFIDLLPPPPLTPVLAAKGGRA
jgi:pimeloyl-ACP methyl ester carboxylesterase